MNGLDLFSGIGGISLALRPYVRTVAYCEKDEYCQGVLLSRMWRGELDRAPIWDDVQTLSGSRFGVEIDIISGGFPCQNLSPMGNKKGLGGESSRLFFQIARLVREVGPGFAFLENVPAITTRGGVEVAQAFDAMGYECRWGVLAAGEVGADHIRARWWMVAHARGAGLHLQKKVSGVQKNIISADPARKVYADLPSCENSAALGREVYGLPHRVDRIRALGNSVVPLCARTAFEILSGIKKIGG